MYISHSIGAWAYACTKSICLIAQPRKIARMIINLTATCDDRDISFVVVGTINLLSTMNVQSSFVTHNFVGREILLAAQSPYCWENVRVWRYLVSPDKFSMLFSM